jgi:hypothetical protein
MYRKQASPVAGLVLFAVLFGAGCEAAPTAPGAPGAARFQPAAARPFMFILTGNANPDFSQGPCHVTNLESGTGIALHMGQVTWSSEEVANFCVDPDDPGRAEVTGAFVITAANGDRLTGSYLSVVAADFAAGTLTAQGDYMITGGTGRFAGATGGGTLSVAGGLAEPFELEGAFVGTIVY